MATATATLKKMFIDGKWVEADSGRTLGVINPATEETIADIAYGGRAETRRALEAAHRAMQSWMKLTSWDRAKVLKKTADLMRERADSIARTLTMEQGKPVPEAKAEILHSADTFEWFAEEGTRAYGEVIPHSAQGKRHMTLKHPVGVVAAISPWNFPVTLPSRKIAPALAAGSPGQATSPWVWRARLSPVRMVTRTTCPSASATGCASLSTPFSKVASTVTVITIPPKS